MPQPKENSPIKRDILFRVHLLYAAFVLIAALVFARLIWVQLFSSEVAYNAERLEGRIFTDEIIPARRGNILTRGGEPLATSLFRYQVEMDYGSPGFDSLRTFREQSDSLAKLLALYFRDKSAAAYAQAMQREHTRRYRVTYRKDTLVPRSEGGLARWWDRMRGEEFLTVKLYDTLRDHTPVALFPREIDYTEWQTLRRYPILNWNMGMTYRLRERDERVYPQGELARRTIGQVGDKGNYGVEYVLRDVLEGRDGKARRQRIARGFYGRVVGGDNSEPEDGLDVVTTLDLEMQDVADRALRRQLEAQNALWGTALVMEVATGDLLAMANLSRTKSGAYAEVKNHALSSRMEPGSTFKLAALLALAIVAMTHLKPVLTSLATARVSNTVNGIVTAAVNETIYSGGVDYDQLISFEKDNEGKITAVKSNMAEFNRLQSAIIDEVLEKLSEVTTKELSVPVGTLLGSPFLAGRGPLIRVRMQSVGSSSAHFENAFTSAGINQTKHQIYLVVDVYVSILLPGFSTTTKFSNTYSVAETVIVGSVPDNYTYFSNGEDMEQNAEDYIMNNG